MTEDQIEKKAFWLLEKELYPIMWEEASTEVQQKYRDRAIKVLYFELVEKLTAYLEDPSAVYEGGIRKIMKEELKELVK